MNNSYIKSICKPYRYTIKGNSLIVESNEGNYVIKKNNNEKLIDIFRYLDSRGFNYYPDVINVDRDNEFIYKYVDDINILNPSKSEDLINLVGLLHSKTSYQKEVSEETFKEIYENIKNNILYLKDYYGKKYDEYLKEIYNPPSHYNFLRNYSKIMAALNFSENELDDWYDIVKTKKTERVSVIHNNLSLDHIIKSDRDYLISWDKAKFDTPVLDLYKLYLNNFFEMDFSFIFERYIKINHLGEEELKLFFVLISMPPEIDFIGSEFEICKKMRKKLDYIFKTEEFLKPYYTTDTDNK